MDRPQEENDDELDALDHKEHWLRSEQTRKVRRFFAEQREQAQAALMSRVAVTTDPAVARAYGEFKTIVAAQAVFEPRKTGAS